MAIVQFNFPTTIKFGPGAVKLAPEALKQRGLRAAARGHRQGPRRRCRMITDLTAALSRPA